MSIVRTHTTCHIFSSVCLWAAPSIRSPVRFRPERRRAPGSRRKRLSARRWRAHRNAAGASSPPAARRPRHRSPRQSQIRSMMLALADVLLVTSGMPIIAPAGIALILTSGEWADCAWLDEGSSSSPTVCYGAVDPPVGGLFGFKFSSRPHPWKFAVKRFLVLREVAGGKWGGLFWATSLEKIIGDVTAIVWAVKRREFITLVGAACNRCEVGPDRLLRWDQAARGALNVFRSRRDVPLR